MQVTMSDVPARATLAAEARRARRATGAMFFAPFGGAWIALGASRSFPAPYIAYALVAAAALLFLWTAIRVRDPALRLAGPLPPETETDRRRNTWFHVINAGQWVLILVAGNVLANVGLGAWVVPAAMFIIGAHFVPLARLFAAPSHYVTGAALMLLAVLYPLLLPAGPGSGVGPVLAGLVLWASAAWALRPPSVHT